MKILSISKEKMAEVVTLGEKQEILRLDNVKTNRLIVYTVDRRLNNHFL